MIKNYNIIQKNRQENARCELFPGSSNGRLIIQARKV